MSSENKYITRIKDHCIVDIVIIIGILVFSLAKVTVYGPSLHGNRPTTIGQTTNISIVEAMIDYIRINYQCWKRELKIKSIKQKTTCTRLNTTEHRS
ncbi:MAG: hypothetical protein WAM14_17135 [Candidatus Nitrosopolaris sp.]